MQQDCHSKQNHNNSCNNADNNAAFDVVVRHQSIADGTTAFVPPHSRTALATVKDFKTHIIISFFSGV
jgi:hypothetical protein